MLLEMCRSMVVMLLIPSARHLPTECKVSAELECYRFTLATLPIRSARPLPTACAADFQKALSDKTRDELEQLSRALFVRGQLESQNFQQKATNPFTGQQEGGVSTPQGAYERGRAGEINTLGNLRGQEARSYL